MHNKIKPAAPIGKHNGEMTEKMKPNHTICMIDAYLESKHNSTPLNI